MIQGATSRPQLAEVAEKFWASKKFIIFVLRKKGSKTKKRMKKEEIEKGDWGPPTRKVYRANAFDSRLRGD